MEKMKPKSSVPSRKWNLAFLVPCCMCLAALVACEKEELPVAPYDRGDVEEITLDMGADYKHQVWFDLGTMQVVAVNSRFDWDIAFDCRDSAHWVYLNSSTVMMAAPTGTEDFEAVTSAKDLPFKPDHHTGVTDSLALGRWWEDNQVWVVDRGYTAEGDARGYLKIQFEPVSDGLLKFRYAKLNGQGMQEGTIAKNERYNRIAFSFDTRKEEYIEPPKAEYDMVFTQYVHLFYEPYTPYLVSGALMNPHETAVLLDTFLAFDEITAEYLDHAYFSTDADAIGYDWKYFDLDAGAYTVFPEMNYVLRDAEGFFYKLHFTDFYSETGEKGFPQLEVKRL